MLRDYVGWLLKTKKHQPSEKKISQRIHDVVIMLAVIGRVPLADFRALPQYEALYRNKSSQSSKSKDLARMKSSQLVRVTKLEGTEYIEPNYAILEQLEYALPKQKA